VALLAGSEADGEPLLLPLLLCIFLPLTLLDNELAGEAVTTLDPTARVGFRLDALSPESESDPDPDPELDPDSDLALDPDPPPRPLKMAPAMPVTESVPTCCPENTIAVVTASAVNVAVEATSTDGEALAD
jgi:hypothetical protein